MAAMAGPLTATVAARVPSGSTVRRDRTTRSYPTSSPAEAGRAVGVYAQPPVSHRTGPAGIAPHAATRRRASSKRPLAGGVTIGSGPLSVAFRGEIAVLKGQDDMAQIPIYRRKY